MTTGPAPFTASEIQDAWPLIVAFWALGTVLICNIPASIAKRKGRSWWAFFLISALVPFGIGWMVMLIIAVSIAKPAPLPASVR
jgi:hypothetical protein